MNESYGTNGSGVPPNAVEAESFFLGALLQDSMKLTECLPILNEDDDFYLEKHQAVWNALKEQNAAGAPIDPIAIEDRLQRQGTLELVGGKEYLFEIANSVSSSVNVEYHADLIRDKAVLRRIIRACRTVIGEAEDHSAESGDLIETAQREIFAISEKQVKKNLKPIASLMKKTLDMIGDYKPGELSGVPTGFAKLDNNTSGLQKTDLIILAGRPGMGKTAFALGLLRNAAVDYGKRVAFFSLEMGDTQLVQRILCRQAEINMHKLRQSSLTVEEYPRIAMAAGVLENTPIYIDDAPALSLVDLRSKCRMLSNREGLDLVVIDYLQLMQGRKNANNRENEISEISRGLKELAKELNVPVLALSQLSRKVEDRPSGHGRPQLSDLRESGAIEQDADMVWFVYRPIQYRKDDADVNESDAELIIAKHRNGPTDNIKLTFRKEWAGFYDRAPGFREYEEEESNF